MSRRPVLPPLTLSAILAMASAAVVVTWLLTHRGGGVARTQSTPTPATAPAATTAPGAAPVGPLALSAAALRAVARSLGEPVYWLGPETGRRYELRRQADGNVYLRYLPAGVRAGAAQALRTVGTYPLPNAFVVTEAIAKEGGATHRTLPGGWLAVYRPSRPTNIYLARKGLEYQIEVFDPSAVAARGLVVSGRLSSVR